MYCEGMSVVDLSLVVCLLQGLWERMLIQSSGPSSCCPSPSPLCLLPGATAQRCFSSLLGPETSTSVAWVRKTPDAFAALWNRPASPVLFSDSDVTVGDSSNHTHDRKRLHTTFNKLHSKGIHSLGKKEMWCWSPIRKMFQMSHFLTYWKIK